MLQFEDKISCDILVEKPFMRFYTVLSKQIIGVDFTSLVKK